MSQNPNSGNYNPYNPNPSNPQYPPAPNTTYGSPPPPPSGPNSGYQQPPSGPNPYADPNTPNSSYGSYNPMSVPPPPPAYNTPSTPMPPALEPNPYDPYAQTAMSPQPPTPTYPGYNPPSMPGVTMPPSMAPQPPKRGRGMVVLISVIVLILVVGGSVIGLVAYNGNQNALHANATATAQANAQAAANAQATTTAIASTYPFSDKLILNDPLVDNSKGVNWDNDKDNGCFFSGSAYHVVDDQKGTYNTCAANKTDYSNFTFEVEMEIKQGDSNAYGGVIFRANNTTFKYYRLYVGLEGDYGLLASVDSTGTNGNARDLKDGTAPQFNTGLGQTNTIGVVARGNQITIYINRQLIATVNDSTYTEGQIGVTASSYSGSKTEVVYTNAKVWQLS